MIVRILKTLDCRLEDHKNLRDFNLVADTVEGRLDEVDAALKAADAGTTDESHAWISEAWVRAQGGDAAWQKDFDAVIVYAKSKSWVDDHGRIRAHVEWISPP